MQSMYREHPRTCGAGQSVTVRGLWLREASPHMAAVGMSGTPKRPTTHAPMLAMPTRRRRKFVQDAPLLAPSRRPIALRHHLHHLAPCAHADPSRHRRHRPDSATPSQSSAQKSSVTFSMRQCVLARLFDLADHVLMF